MIIMPHTIETLLAERWLSACAAAKRIGVNRRTVDRWLSGDRLCQRFATVDELREALDK